MSTKKPTILAAFAHPDDEAFATGGTLARYAASGDQVVLVCATRGEAGEISDPTLATQENLGQVREAELRCAAENMGIAELIFLDYRDSGMAGTPENEDPRAFMNARTEEVVQKLVAIIRQVQPQIVTTFEPNGGYGHPDHITIHKHTLAAFHAAANSQCYPELGPPWQAERLFYTAIRRSFFINLRKELEKIGEDLSDFDYFEDEEAGWPDNQVNVTIDVSSTVEAKWDALECHRTQFGPDNLLRKLPEEKAKQLLSYESFSLAWPEPKPGLQLADLFSRLDLE